MLFIGLAIYLVTLPGSAAGYRYIFVLEPEGLLDPMVWVYALGQAFFSLSVAGNGTLVYGSYLSKDSDIPADARMVALFDTLAAILAALVIIPAMAVAGQQLNNSGPGLMFIFLPNVLQGIPGGRLILIVFFLAVLFAALTSLINLFEAPLPPCRRCSTSAARRQWPSSVRWASWWDWPLPPSSPPGWTCAPSTSVPSARCWRR